MSHLKQRHDEQRLRGRRRGSRLTRALGCSITIGLLLVLQVGCGGDEPPPAPPTPDEASLRTTAQGSLVGFKSDDGAHVWRGIPFAEPPVGELRWRAPKSAGPWEGTLEALEFGSPCIQFAGPAGRSEGLEETDVRGSEDCLYLNVFAPAFAKDAVPAGQARLPVMVWIHGGGNTIGDAHVYDGSVLANAQDVIVVTIHYRMGVLGWFSHSSLKGEGTTALDQSGNFGTLDTIAALRWVKDHISSFGGDPDRVTVFGESAGGTDTIAMLISPAAAGLFQRAIVQSGSGDTIELSTAENAFDDTPPGHPMSSNELLWAMMIADGDVADRKAARSRTEAMTADEIANYLRSRSAEALLAQFDGRFGGMYRVPMMFRDGQVLPLVDAREAFASGEYNAVPAIFGTNRDENKLFMAFGSPHVARMGPMPLWFKNERLYNLNAEYGTKTWKARGVDEPAAAVAKAGVAPAFAYRFDWDEEGRFLWVDLARLIGAGHAVEIPFVFGRLNLGPATEYVFPPESQPAARVLADQMMSYWGEFARTGDPGQGRSGDLPAWRAWAGDSGPFMILDTEAGGGLRHSSETLTSAKVMADLARDDRFESPVERCEIYGALVAFGERMTMDEYASIEDGLCKGVALPIN